MKHLLSVIILTFLLSFSGKSQSLIGIEAGYGTYLSNSENDLSVLTDHKIWGFYVLGINYGLNISDDFLLSVDYDFRSSNSGRIIKYELRDDNNNFLRNIDYDYKLINHSFDLVIKTDDKSDVVNYGIGPSFVITNRILGEGTDIYDKLASSAIGVCGVVELREPFKLNVDPFTYSFQLKLRYSHSVWFDKGIRKLDGYKQEFVSVQVGLKILLKLQ